MGDARVGRLSIRARSSGSPLAVQALSASEKAIRSALERLPDTEELVVLRRVRLLARGTVNQPWELERALERQVARVIAAGLANATRFGETVNLNSSEGVAFASEAVAVAQYLLALERGAGDDFPFRAFAGWGKNTQAVVEHAMRRGRAFSGDVLAEFARKDAIDALISIAGKSQPTRLEDLWFDASAAGRNVVAGLPPRTFRELLSRLERVLARY